MVNEDLAPPQDNEVTVEVRAIGLNFADVFTVLGLYRAAPRTDCVPGIEFSGVVVRCGAHVSGFPVGSRVMGSIRFGAYTTHLNIDQRYVMAIPQEWTFEEGASFIVQALTAYYALVPLGNLKAHQTVLIHSAVGGVGIYANRIAKRLSAFTIGTVGSPSKLPLAREEGYDAVIVRRRSFPRDLRAALDGRPLELVLDAIGGRIQRQSFDALAETGRIVAYGLSEFGSRRPTPNYAMLAWRYIRLPRYHSLSLIEWNRSILGFNLIWLYDRVDVLRAMLNEIQALQLPKPRIGAIYPFGQMKEAFRTFQSGTTTGKVVVQGR
jgi:NADPH:quinone reductase-like Zn-dependent oxidoreductase